MNTVMPVWVETHFNTNYFWPVIYYLLPWLFTLWGVGFVFRSFFDPGFFRFHARALRMARAMLMCTYLSVGLSLLFCWGAGSGFTDMFGTEPLVTPSESLGWSLIVGAFAGYAFLGAAAYVADASLSLLAEVTAVGALGVRWATKKRAVWMARQ